MNIFESMKGYVIYHCLYVGIKTKIFGYINQKKNKGITSEDVSNALGLFPDYVSIWLNTALAFGILELKEEKFYVKDEYVKHLLDDKDSSFQGEMIEIFVEYLSPDMLKQASYMKTGETFVFSDHDSRFVELISNRGYLRAKSFVDNFLKENSKFEKIFKQKSEILDIGCGSGSFIQGLNESYETPSYYGVDVDEKSIKLANNSKDSNVAFFHSKIEDLNFSEKFDAITMVLSLHELCDLTRESVVRKCFQLLKPNGYLLIMEFPYPETEDEFVDSKFLMGTLDQYFEMIWGTKHIGWTEQKRIISESGFKNIERVFSSDGVYMFISAQNIG